ncbi:outer membrane beta-barrel protein [Flavobacterium chuncheonense]|uniref:Outer membrane beta-barrel protein n=1 Tax=Flavobacterium chuncheonense TaxID=2026653 RepID=A0ABW5YJS5_9FLAO
MKIIKSLIFLFASITVFAQDNIVDDNTKPSRFQIGVHYVGNLRDKNNVVSDGFNGIVGLDAQYAFYSNSTIKISGGLSVDYLQSREVFLTDDTFVWNPKASIEVDAFNAKLKPFCAIGYAFFTNNFDLTPIDYVGNEPIYFSNRNVKFNYNGITLQPGLRYHLSKLLYLEGSYKFYAAKSDGFDANFHFINLGFGFKV